MTIRIDDEVKTRLSRLAASTHRSQSGLAAQAIQEFVETHEWQLGEIDAAIREADAKDFASEAEVQSLRRKWQVNAH